MFAVFCVCYVSHVLILLPNLTNIHGCMYLATELTAGGCIPGPVDQHSAAAGSDPSSAQLGDVYHGCAHVFSHVL